ncbi:MULTISPECIES: ABC transporter ATP-binding protein [Lonsdalea]|uniref:ABC transporter ATP-binding protein n=2 Tax=Lonsdalea TaxID=1082702 RepID=A0AAD0SGJ6_9GAMM|nr:MULTISPECIES: ABC transporter ATP-binding protein [Lonsdalea]AXW87492.1 ABC transporter ATP-binding protein [Lonsdalea britannica]OSM99981.1 ABC transporter ATP-binding protein [Lonsdalea britannica]OSN08510.1 ABC transporter ATP-binding protein [Lonsdalea iberica]
MRLPEQQLQDFICLSGITQVYPTGTSSQVVLQNLSLSIPVGQSCSITGPSGSGKSTLLNIIGLLDKPLSGKVLLAGEDVSTASDDVRARARNQIIGFVFQGFNLLSRLNALDNVALPLLYRGLPKSIAREQAQLQLDRVGLAERLYYRPADLSGGQRQRVAIARALVGEPALLLADEPTGNLDQDTANEIVALLLSLNETAGTTLVMVTHDEKMAERMERRIRIGNGHIVEDTYAAR